MDWTTIGFVWVNVALVIGLVIWMESRRLRDASAALTETRKVLDLYVRASADSRSEHVKNLETVTAQCRLMLEHDAAMAAGQSRALLASLRGIVAESGTLNLKLLSTFLLAEQTAAGRVAGNGDAGVLVQSIDRIGAMRVDLGTPQPTERDNHEDGDLVMPNMAGKVR